MSSSSSSLAVQVSPTSPSGPLSEVGHQPPSWLQTLLSVVTGRYGTQKKADGRKKPCSRSIRGGSSIQQFNKLGVGWVGIILNTNRVNSCVLTISYF
jgi:hypothetical protein